MTPVNPVTPATNSASTAVPSRANTIGLLITGNEVLFGKTRDTNGPFMASHLRRVGCEVKRSLVSGDDRAELARSLSYLAETCDSILMTGGLGPTSDDLTADVVARFFGLPTVFSEPAWQACVDAFTRLGRDEVPATNRKQAELPQGAQLVPNPIGTAVGFETRGTHAGKEITIICLPGVPFEMEPMFLESVLPSLTVKGAVSVQRTWQVFGLGESAMQERIAPLEKRIAEMFPEAIVSYQAHAGYVTYAVFAQSFSELRCAELDTALAGFVNQGVCEAFGHHVVAQTDLLLAPHVVKTFIDAQKWLAVAESCTGGLLSKELVAVAGSSSCYLGGVTAYSNELKQEYLGVGEGTLARDGAVSESTAAEMAQGLLVRTRADVGLSITGVAGPGGGSERTPVGLVCFGLAVRKGALDERALIEKLGMFRWQPVLPLGKAGEHRDDVFLMAVTQKFGARMRRDVIQMRSSVYALGCLAVVASLFEGQRP